MKARFAKSFVKIARSESRDLCVPSHACWKNLSTQGALIISNFSNPADPCAVYLSELKQLEIKLRSLRERATQAKRNARDTHAIYWAHVSEMQHLNTKLAEVLASWQIETNGKAVAR